MAKRNFIPLVPSGTINADASVAQLEQDVLAMDAKVGELAEDIGDTEQEINNLKSEIDEVYSDKTFTLSGATAQVYPYTFVPNKTYYVSNKTDGTSPGVRTCDASGSETIEWIKNGLAYGETVAFMPTKNASYFRIYSANGDCDIEIATNGAVLDNVDSEISSVDEKADRINEMLGNVTKYKNWERYRKPQGFSADIPIGIYTDGHSYITDYNKENFKNAGGNTYYISPNGSDGYDGSRNTPWRSPYTAFTRASSGDTIVFLKGDYDRNTTDMATGIVTKSLNIIGEGKVRIFNGDWCTFTAVSGYNNVYKTTRSLGSIAYEVDSVGDEILLMTLVDSIANVEATVGSYYKDGNDFYVHPQKAGTPNAGGAKIFITVDYVDFLSFDNSNQNVKAYIENITMIGSSKSFRFYRSSASNTLDVCMDHVNLMWCGYDSRNAVEVFGGNAIFNECKIFGSYRDGFNYNGTDTSGITYRDNMIVEINCEASNCGIGRTEVNMNGSTAHRNSKVVRVNCTYHDNHGPNCADVQEDTESVNLGCIAYNSTADADIANINFECATDGAKMWLENCIGVGAHADFYCPSEASMYMSKCSYDTKSGEGITETDAVPPIVWMLRNYDTSEQILRH